MGLVQPRSTARLGDVGTRPSLRRREVRRRPMFSLAAFVSAMLDPRPSRSGAAAGRAHSDDGCDHLSYARARPHTIGSSLFGEMAAAAELNATEAWRATSGNTNQALVRIQWP